MTLPFAIPSIFYGLLSVCQAYFISLKHSYIRRASPAVNVLPGLRSVAGNLRPRLRPPSRPGTAVPAGRAEVSSGDGGRSVDGGSRAGRRSQSGRRFPGGTEVASRNADSARISRYFSRGVRSGRGRATHGGRGAAAGAARAAEHVRPAGRRHLRVGRQPRRLLRRRRRRAHLAARRNQGGGLDATRRSGRQRLRALAGGRDTGAGRSSSARTSTRCRPAATSTATSARSRRSK